MRKEGRRSFSSKMIKTSLLFALTLIIAVIGYRSEKHISRCQEISRLYDSVHDSDDEIFKFSNTGRYIALNDAPSRGLLLRRIYDRQTCRIWEIENSIISFYAWSPEDNYLVTGTSIAGSSACRTLTVYSGDGTQQYYHLSGCFQNAEKTYIFYAWLDEFHLILRNSPLGRDYAILNLADETLIENLSIEEVEDFSP